MVFEPGENAVRLMAHNIRRLRSNMVAVAPTAATPSAGGGMGTGTGSGTGTGVDPTELTRILDAAIREALDSHASQSAAHHEKTAAGVDRHALDDAITPLQSEIDTLQIEIQTNTTNIANNVRISSANAASLRTLGNRFDGSEDLQSVTVSTPQSYVRTLDSQLSSAMPLLLVIVANITGTRGMTDFDWDSGDVLYFPPQSVAPEYLFSIAGSDIDLSAYRTAAMQDIVDNRHTAGILLARQEAATADGKAVAAQEDAADNATALGGKQDTLTALSEVPGLQAALDAKQASPVPIGDVTGLQAALDSATALADPVIEPSHR